MIIGVAAANSVGAACDRKCVVADVGGGVAHPALPKAAGEPFEVTDLHPVGDGPVASQQHDGFNAGRMVVDFDSPND